MTSTQVQKSSPTCLSLRATSGTPATSRNRATVAKPYPRTDRRDLDLSAANVPQGAKAGDGKTSQLGQPTWKAGLRMARLGNV
jgi:hypothetical protein